MDRVIWRPPRLRTLETDERTSTWTELFYDLVYVVAVAQLGTRLLHEVSWQGFFEFVALFTVLWWAWASFTFFADRYDTDDTAQRLLAMTQVVGVAGMAASLGLGDQHLSTISQAFGASYAAVRLALVLMYARAWRHVPLTQPLVGGYLKGFTIEVALWAIATVVPTPMRYWLWAAGIVISFATPWLMRREQVRVPLSVSHLPERFGLFTILVFGESIAAVVQGVSSTEWRVTPTYVGVISVVIAASLWWIYFDNLEGSVVRRDPNKRHDWRPTAWIYSHLPLAITLTMAGIGVEALVAGASGHEFAAADRWLAAGGTAGALLAMAMILVSSTPADPRLRLRRKATMRAVGAALVVLLGVAGGSVEPPVFGTLLALICLAEVALDIADHWYSVERPSRASSEGTPAPSADDPQPV